MREGVGCCDAPSRCEKGVRTGDVFSGVIRSHFASIYAIVAALGEAMRLCGNVTHLEVA